MKNRKGPVDWKDKYLAALDKEEKNQKQQQQLMSLLSRAVMRISLIAAGVDVKLDQQLAGLRAMLSEDRVTRRDLTLVVNALEGQVKRLNAVKTERSKLLAQGFKSLVAQLNALKPKAVAKKQLSNFEKTLKKRTTNIQEYSVLIHEFSQLQKKVLDSSLQSPASKPFWHSWVPDPSVENISAGAGVTETSGGSEFPETDNSDDDDVEVVVAEEVDENAEDYIKVDSKHPKPIIVDQINDGLDLSDDKVEPRKERDPKMFAEEPSYSRLNQHIRDVLSELLDQIEVPPLATENYSAARQQINAGLPWYELIPTLEDITMVVVSAFDLRQQEFEQYLAHLNSRLEKTRAFISASKQTQEEGVQANLEFDQSLRKNMSAMRLSIDSATEIDQLKSTVNSSIDQIVIAMDEHKHAEKDREESLTNKLNALVKRVKLMESESKLAEKHLEDQRQKALRDVLTQLPNRGAYEQRLQLEFERWKRYGHGLSLVVCDIDLFKRINDSYGHLAGDKVLRIIAKTLVKRLRATDFIARYGGEEFVVLMPETNQDQALRVVDGVREAIANCPFHFKDEEVSVTMSFGVTEFFEGDLADGVFARSDKALYAAKDGGRNCCVLASDS
ncbi:MAG: diguanylate cyclase [Oceanicoccus sp.]|jgi:diguanylate cyclase